MTAQKRFLADLHLGFNQLLGARIENLTAAAIAQLQATIAATGPADFVGYTVFDTTAGKLRVHNGTSFELVQVEIAGDIVFRGAINPGAPGALDTRAGSQYVFSAAGNLVLPGVTLVGGQSAAVEAGDMLLFTAANTATLIQRNTVASTEALAGVLRIATSQEVLDGSLVQAAVTPAYLQAKLAAQIQPLLDGLRADVDTLVSEVANLQAGLVETQARDVPKLFRDTITLADGVTNVTHGLRLTHKDGFVARLFEAATGDPVEAKITGVDTQNVAIEAQLPGSGGTLAGVTVVVFGI